MISSGHILTINPGSTSTKLGIYGYNLATQSIDCVKTHHIALSPGTVAGNSILDQLGSRLDTMRSFLATTSWELDLIMARGAPLRPLAGGTYIVDDAMLADLRSCKYAEHASNLAAIMGAELARERNVPVYIADPITSDEFEAVARISGVPAVQRKSRSHALNIKASTRKLCQRLELSITESRWVVAHLGGGISIAALDHNRIIDVNDALLGMGPFSPERAGALPLSGLIELAFSGRYQRPELEHLLSRESGLRGYLGTSDLQVVEERIQAGDSQAELVFQAMVYQISKEIAAMASVLNFQLNGILLTGGMANSELLCTAIQTKIAALGPVYLEPGENELEALALAGLRILTGEDKPKAYDLTHGEHHDHT